MYGGSLVSFGITDFVDDNKDLNGYLSGQSDGRLLWSEEKRLNFDGETSKLDAVFRNL